VLETELAAGHVLEAKKARKLSELRETRDMSTTSSLDTGAVGREIDYLDMRPD
jgi:hypothetical protein